MEDLSTLGTSPDLFFRSWDESRPSFARTLHYIHSLRLETFAHSFNSIYSVWGTVFGAKDTGIRDLNRHALPSWDLTKGYRIIVAQGPRLAFGRYPRALSTET